VPPLLIEAMILLRTGSTGGSGARPLPLAAEPALMVAVTTEVSFMSRQRKDRMLFVDTEQTCWDAPSPPPGQEPEIIEIGVAEVDVGALEVVRAKSMLVRPYRSAVSDFCTALTGLDAAALKRDGRRFAEVANSVRKEFGTAQKMWVSWGRDDETVARDCAATQAANPFPGPHVDLGALWGMMSGAKAAVGLAEALQSEGLEWEGLPHRGMPDAVNLARLFIQLARRQRQSVPAPAFALLS
jgi:inhibitor of KinA sporulation pathway (predicted exonuclease)